MMFPATSDPPGANAILQTKGVQLFPIYREKARNYSMRLSVITLDGWQTQMLHANVAADERDKFCPTNPGTSEARLWPARTTAAGVHRDQ
jgi:hypothetical protein